MPGGQTRSAAAQDPSWPAYKEAVLEFRTGDALEDA